MSRTGSKPVAIPDGVTVELAASVLSAKGPKGQLTMPVAGEVEFTVADGAINVKPRGNSKFARSMWGTQRAPANNMVQGVHQGFERKLQITGVGYRAQVKGKTLNLQLGYSHDIDYPIPEGVEINCPDQTTILISGIDKQKIGKTASEIRAFRKPEPYKGKGVRHAGEYIFRKEGKKK